MKFLAILSVNCLALTGILPSFVQGMPETDRVAEYDSLYPRSWPPKDYVPNNEGWKNTHEHRFNQIREMGIEDGRYEGKTPVCCAHKT